MNHHMDTKHPAIWAEAKRVENQALGKLVDEEVQPMLFALSFNIDVFYDKVICWITISNQPFSEIESDELLDVFYCLCPTLQNKIIKSDALRDCITVVSKAQRQQFKEYLQLLAADLLDATESTATFAVGYGTCTDHGEK
ncbi:hypothetical protein FRC01_013729 [Tulasnella sp. 417]|nr:hypothetical protein FRC01_013729 [Tulasnella sp. 417]